MKTRITVLINVVIVYTIIGQTTYYRNAEGAIFSKEEIEGKQQVFYEKFVKKHENVIVEIDIKDTEVRQDSTIHDFGFHIDLNGRTRKKTKLQSLKGQQMLESLLTTLEGNQIKISELQGKPTLLNFWFASCPPCIDEMPELNKLKQHYGDRVNFVAITYEPKEKVKKFLKKHTFDFKQVVGANAYIEALEMKAFPKNIILDQNGIVQSIEAGIAYVQGEDGKLKIGEATMLMKKLEKLLK